MVVTQLLIYTRDDSEILFVHNFTKISDTTALNTNYDYLLYCKANYIVYIYEVLLSRISRHS